MAIGPLVRLFIRNMYHFIENRNSWCNPKVANKNVEDKLKFCRNNTNIHNGYKFKLRPLTSCLLFTDASNKGYGEF